jgi:site-specific recombinase XerD
MLQGYVQKAKLTKPVTFHSFRRSCATGMIRNNANVMHVRQMLGHTSMEAIQSYIDLTIVDLKKAHQKTHPREKQANFFKA